MTRLGKFSTALAGALFALAPWSMADISMDRKAISSGGGTSTGSRYELTGTIGQSVIQPAAQNFIKISPGFWNAVLILQFPELGESFNTWMASLPPDQLPAPDQQGALDEPANDGVPNILKYALGLYPLDASRDGYPRLAWAQNTQNPDEEFMVIELIRSAAANVAFFLEGSVDLSVWNDVPFSVDVLESLPNGRERVWLITGVSLAPEEKFFLRLDVQFP